MTSATAVYDIRCNEEFGSFEDIIGLFKDVVKHYSFQLEESDGGYRHYQGRISLIKKRRRPELVKFLKESANRLADLNYLEPTCNPEYLTGSFCYVLKADTRIAGPWTDKDEKKVMTYQLKLFNSWELRPYQAELMKQVDIFEMRCIDLIYDKNGNLGKSLFCEAMEYLGKVEEVPPFRLMDDIFAWVCSRPIKKCYVFDMPRGMKKDKLADFYAGVEVVKNGVAYDKRYTAQKKRFDRPRIFIFTNTLPMFSLMSKDRWKLWQIDENFELIKYEE